MRVQLTAGTALAPLQLPRKPNDVDAPGERAPFQLRFRAVTTDPPCVSVAFHAWLTCWPVAKENVAVQLEDAAVEALRTVTSPWNPPDHCDATR